MRTYNHDLAKSIVRLLQDLGVEADLHWKADREAYTISTEMKTFPILKAIDDYLEGK